MAQPEKQGTITRCERNEPVADRQVGIARRVVHAILSRPVPLPPPEVANNYGEMGTVPRVLECLRYGASRLEYAISPGGHLRTFLLINLRAVLLFAVPAAALGICVFALLPACQALAACAAALAAGVLSLLNALLYGIAIAAIVLGFAAIVRTGRKNDHKKYRHTHRTYTRKY